MSAPHELSTGTQRRAYFPECGGVRRLQSPSCTRWTTHSFCNRNDLINNDGWFFPPDVVLTTIL